MSFVLYAILGLPLFAAVYVGWNSKTIAPKTAERITSGFLCLSAILSWITFFVVTSESQIVHLTLMPWFASETFQANWAIYVDSLTAVMLIVVTTVSAVVHLYSIGYMHDDPHVPRFMAYLSLFTLFMLILVTANNLFQLFQ